MRRIRARGASLNVAATGFILVVFGLALAAGPVAGQPQCGYATSVQFPVDPAIFFLAQEFGAASPRHQGRYHTGEDWALPDGAARGQIVFALANGRVVVSSPSAWGGDGGVLILEHTFPDGSVALSMFGHLTEADGITFPPALSCVQVGEPLATIADVRPVPHVHIEIRTGDNLTPGAGYAWDAPDTLGLRRPSKFLTNQALQLHPAYRWRADLADEAGPLGAPVVLDDLSLVYLDGGRVNRITSDGRLLWRTPLDQPAVGLLPSDDGLAWVVFGDGRWQRVARDGALLDVLETGVPTARTLLALPSRQIVQVSDGRIAAFTPAGGLLWTSDAALPSVIQMVEEPVSGRLALMARDVQGMGHFRLLDVDGVQVDTATLDEPASMTFAPSGELWVYAQGGLWVVDAAGEWTLADEDASPGGKSAAVAFLPDGGSVRFDGQTLVAVGPDGIPRWQTSPGAVGGQNQLSTVGDQLLLVSSDGDLIVWRASDGAECGRARLWGGPSSWAQLGSDGLLRAYIADQIAGLDWTDLTDACGRA